MSLKTETFRDATYSAETQEKLRGLSHWLDLPRGARGNPLLSEVAALRDVIDRWDANDATETTFPADGDDS